MGRLRLRLMVMGLVTATEAGTFGAAALVIGIVLEVIYMGLRWRSKTWLKVALHKSEIYRRHLRHRPVERQQAYLHEIRTPLMAYPNTRELIDEEGVLYTVPVGEDVRVRFDQNGYTTDPERRHAPV